MLCSLRDTRSQQDPEAAAGWAVDEGAARLEAESSSHVPLSHFLTATWSFVCDFILSVFESPWKIGISLLLDRFAECETAKEHTPAEESQLLISDDVPGPSFNLMES